MSEADFTLTVLGTRGSMAVCGDDYAVFGGSTSCYLVRAGRQSVLLDAGSGLLKAPLSFPEPPAILLSHWHLDHLLGLGMYGRLSMRGEATRLYAPATSDEAALGRLNALYRPPYWPLKLTQYGGSLDVRVMPETLSLGALSIEATEGNHPGGCLVFRLRHHGKTIVYATDFEHEDGASARLAAFAQGADLILYDGQYCAKDYDAHRGFGHSTPEAGLRLMEASGARRLLLVHHDPTSTDETLRQRERQIGRDDIGFAREGQVIEL